MNRKRDCQMNGQTEETSGEAQLEVVRSDNNYLLAELCDNLMKR